MQVRASPPSLRISPQRSEKNRSLLAPMRGQGKRGDNSLHQREKDQKTPSFRGGCGNVEGGGKYLGRAKSLRHQF